MSYFDASIVQAQFAFEVWQDFSVGWQIHYKAEFVYKEFHRIFD